MAIEIRELVIKTVIVSEHRNDQFKIKSEMLNDIRKEVIEECKSLLANTRKQNIHKR